MRIFKKRATASVILALGLSVGAVAVPANAISQTVVTIVGHVYDEKGHPIAGITASSGCGCGYEGGTPPAFISGTDVTSKTGYFSYRVLTSSARYVTLTDPKGRYIQTSVQRFSKSGGVLKTKKTMLRAAQISGTIRDEIGRPVGSGQIHVFDAVTGKTFRIADNSTDENGRYHAIVPAGTYKVRFSGVNDWYGAEWYGDVSARADSPSVTVAAGGKATGINATVTKLLRIQGSTKLTDKKRFLFRGDQVGLTATDATGAVVYQGIADGLFFLEKMQPGAYTLSFAPIGSAFFVPKTVSVTLPAHEDLDHVDVTLDYVPATSDNKRSVAFGWGGPPSTSKKGALYDVDFTVFSNESVAGGTATFFVDGQKIDRMRVPASGKVTLRTRFDGVRPGTYTIWAAFTGTDTTLPGKQKTYSVTVTK